MTTRTFTADKIAIIRELKRYGVPNRIVATVVNVDVDSLRARCSQLGIRRGGYLGARVGARTQLMFYGEAQRRGLRAANLVESVLKTVARDDLFDAVLDNKNGSR